jgi:sulfur carrier protein
MEFLRDKDGRTLRVAAFFFDEQQPMIDVEINGQKRSIPDRSTVRSLLEDLGIADRQGTAVAVNMEVVPRKAHTATVLQTGDRVEIVQAVGGG